MFFNAILLILERRSEFIDATFIYDKEAIGAEALWGERTESAQSDPVATVSTPPTPVSTGSTIANYVLSQASPEHYSNSQDQPTTASSFTSEVPGTPSTNQSIPSRIKSQKSLVVKTSSIDGAGRGIFTTEPVKAGELIFSIPNPHLSIADSGHEKLKNTCDWCFACRGHPETMRAIEHLILPTLRTVRHRLNFFECERCKLLHYCSKFCQARAWENHHRFECGYLSKMRDTNLLRNGEPMTFDRTFRLR